MASTPRFTGSLPDAAALERWSNWRLALDEEEVEGQDESTLKPDEEQDEIGYETVCTAADAIGPDGKRRLAILGGTFDLGANVDEAAELHVLDGDTTRKVDLLYDWWFPVNDGPTLRYHDFAGMPMQVATRLPGDDGEPLGLVLMPDGRLLRGADSAPPFEVPRVLRIGDVPAASLVEPDVRVRFGEYEIDAKGKRTRVGETWSLMRAGAAPGTAETVGETTTKTFSGVMRTVFDLATHELVEQDVTLAGRRHHFTRAGAPGAPGGIPDGLFGDGTAVMQSLPLAPGLRVAVPYLHPYGYTSVSVHEVLGTGEAPGHAGVRAWRVRSYGGGITESVLWLAMDDRRQLASVVRSLRDDRDAHATIRES